MDFSSLLLTLPTPASRLKLTGFPTSFYENNKISLKTLYVQTLKEFESKIIFRKKLLKSQMKRISNHFQKKLLIQALAIHEAFDKN